MQNLKRIRFLYGGRHREKWEKMSLKWRKKDHSSGNLDRSTQTKTKTDEKNFAKPCKKQQHRV